MKFVHLTYRTRARTIERSGLRLGRDLRGRGVCCMPLMLLRYASPRSELDEDRQDRHLSSGPISSSRTWRWLMSLSRRPAVAVVFQPRASQWPADLYLWVPSRARPALERRVAMLGDDVRLTHVEREPSAWLGEDPAHAHSFRIERPRAMGRLLADYFALRPVPLWAPGDISVEVVFRKPIPRQCIHRIVPLSTRRDQSRATARRRAIERELTEI